MKNLTSLLTNYCPSLLKTNTSYLRRFSKEQKLLVFLKIGPLLTVGYSKHITGEGILSNLWGHFYLDLKKFNFDMFS